MASYSTDRFGILDKWRLLKLFCSNPNLKQSDKVAAFWLLDHFNGKTHLCNPKIETLAREMNVVDSTVKRSVADAEPAVATVGGRGEGT